MSREDLVSFLTERRDGKVGQPLAGNRSGTSYASLDLGIQSEVHSVLLARSGALASWCMEKLLESLF